MAASPDVRPVASAQATRRRQLPAKQTQRGQSAVFVLLFLGILLISLNYLYKQGRVVSDKMEMQNAADAIAYSISLTEARDLNFASYLNRAMVANEVAIGQLLGLASWSYLIESYADFLNAYVKPLEYIPIVNAIPATFYSVTAAVFRTPGKIIQKFLSAIANIGTSFMHLSNKAYGYAQLGYHVATVILSAGSISELLEENAPPGTRISDYGWISLISHFATSGSLGSAVTLAEDISGKSVPGIPWPNGTPDSIKDQFTQYVQSYNPARKVKVADYNNGDKGAAEGYERFAAIVRDSRDVYTMNRSWELKPFEFLKPVIDPIPLVSVKDGNFNLDIDLSQDFGIVGWDFEINFYFGIAVARDGASELRLLVPKTGTFEAGNIASWSSADTSSLAAELGLSFNVGVWAEIPIVGRLTVGGNGGIHFADEKATVSFGVDIGPISVTVIPETSVPFPTSAPFGAGFTEAGRTGKNDLKQLTTMRNSVLGGPVPTDAYGGAANRTIVWNLIPIPPPLAGPVPPSIMPPGVAARSDTTIGAVYGDTTTRVNKSYQGLPPYIDTAGVDQTLFGFGAPHVTISLALDEEDHDKDRAQALIDVDSAGNHPEMGNDATAMTADGLKLTDGMAGGATLASPLSSTSKLHTLARAEVYFKRPNDLNWFKRLDGREENGSAFNPYWHARLTELRYVDSVAALAIEQKEDFSGATEVMSKVIGDVKGALAPWFSVLENLGLDLLVPESS